MKPWCRMLKGLLFSPNRMLLSTLDIDRVELVRRHKPERQDYWIYIDRRHPTHAPQYLWPNLAQYNFRQPVPWRCMSRFIYTWPHFKTPTYTYVCHDEKKETFLYSSRLWWWWLNIRQTKYALCVWLWLQWWDNALKNDQ